MMLRPRSASGLTPENRVASEPFLKRSQAAAQMPLGDEVARHAEETALALDHDPAGFVAGRAGEGDAEGFSVIGPARPERKPRTRSGAVVEGPSTGSSREAPLDRLDRLGTGCARDER